MEYLFNELPKDVTSEYDKRYKKLTKSQKKIFDLVVSEGAFLTNTAGSYYWMLMNANGNILHERVHPSIYEGLIAFMVCRDLGKNGDRILVPQEKLGLLIGMRMYGQHDL